MMSLPVTAERRPRVRRSVSVAVAAAWLVLGVGPWPTRSSTAETAPTPARAKPSSGKIAVFNAGRAGWEVATAASSALARHVGGWARAPSIAAYLAGRPHPGALPAGRVGLELRELVDRLRGDQRPSIDDLHALGRMLAVDYLLLLRVRDQGLSARLFSVHRRRYAPQGYEAAGGDVTALEPYLRAQTVDRGAGRPPDGQRRRWWLWAAAAAAATVAIVIAVGTGGSDREGDLRVRVERR